MEQSDKAKSLREDKNEAHETLQDLLGKFKVDVYDGIPDNSNVVITVRLGKLRKAASLCAKG